MDSKKAIFLSFKKKGGFTQYKDYEEYQGRNDKKEEPIRVIKESRSEEIQRLKASYNPKSTDPEELKKLEKERVEKEDKDWREKNLLTKEHRERFNSWGKDAEISDEEPELSEDEKSSLAEFNKIFNKS